MKKRFTAYFIIFVLVVGCIFASGCGRAAENPSKASEVTVEENETSASLEGIYKYDYEYDTEASVEDHYIVLEINDRGLEGRYYGTSDDFDEAREGYHPGFYVSDMQNLQINDNEITFSIELHEKDMFSNPVDLKYKDSEEVPLSENPQWVNSQIVEAPGKNPRGYKGEIVDGKLSLYMKNGQRVFTKLDDKQHTTGK